jgi:uncharacterized integral membrane protein
MTSTAALPETYQGHFGPFTITDVDRREVVIYRAGLTLAAVSFAIGVGALLIGGPQPIVLQGLAVLYGLFWLGLGISLWKIHIYMRPLHLTLQVFWAIGGLASVAAAIGDARPLALTVYQQPLWILGMGFTFAALTGIFFKEAFCFNRLETKFLTPIVPALLLGHMLGLLPIGVEQGLLVVWAMMFSVFAARKVIQAIPPDIGDKSVFDHLEQEAKSAQANAV